uniref:Methyltransf_11 domain-containing protein n=1 Tax=Strongyloides papillosus TaxID=174720 RepID=A0A0N5BX12_STREA
MEGNQKYSTESYWNERFKDEESYEWIADFETFSDVLLKYLDPNDKILHIGCGNSQLSQRLYDKGFKNITNLDFSSVVVERGILHEPHFSWKCDDMKTLSTIESDSFDIVLEKAAIESLTTREKSPWNYSEETLSDIDKIFRSVQRVLKNGGKFISISFTQPHFRIPHMLKYPFWDIVTDTFGTHFHFFVYVSTLGRRPSKEVIEKYENFLERKTTDNLGLKNDNRNKIELNQTEDDKKSREDGNLILQWLTL